MQDSSIHRANPPGTELNKTDEAICTYMSLLGVLIALIGLIQLLVYSDFSSIPLLLMILYIVNIITFTVFGLQKRLAPECILIGIIVSFIIWLIYSFAYIFSLIVIVLVKYNLVVGGVMLVQDLYKKIKTRSKLLKTENEYWKGKL